MLLYSHHILQPSRLKSWTDSFIYSKACQNTASKKSNTNKKSQNPQSHEHRGHYFSENISLPIVTSSCNHKTLLSDEFSQCVSQVGRLPRSRRLRLRHRLRHLCVKIHTYCVTRKVVSFLASQRLGYLRCSVVSISGDGTKAKNWEELWHVIS